MSRSRPRHAGGFAYLWLLMVVALLGLGSAAAIEVQQTLSQRDRERELLAIGAQYRQALTSYVEAQPAAPSTQPQPSASVSASATFTALAGPQNLTRYPASLEDLLKDERFPGIKRHLRKVFVDPMTGKAEWGYVRVGGRLVGVHSLSEEPPLKQQGFESFETAFNGALSYSQWIFSPDTGMLPVDKP
jgi:type II secretory pathway pseudopilin PulG